MGNFINGKARRQAAYREKSDKFHRDNEARYRQIAIQREQDRRNEIMQDALKESQKVAEFARIREQRNQEEAIRRSRIIELINELDDSSEDLSSNAAPKKSNSILALGKVKCPSCRVISMVNIVKCRTHTKSGEIPEDFDEKVAEIVKLGLPPPTACIICTKMYADVTLPDCGHNDCCYDCVVTLAKQQS
jgi:hypothetical protein